jgi:hypothetical protein
MSEQGIKEAFDAYRTDPGGEVRIDTAAITTAGRRRVRRNQVLIGAAGLGVVAALVGTAVVVPQLADNDRGLSVAAAPELPPSTGRDVSIMFKDARGFTPSVKTESGGAAQDTARKFLANLGATPTNADVAWQAEAGSDKPGVIGAVFTWVDGGTFAEGVLTVVKNPVHTMIFPPSYTVCGPNDTAGGSTCSVREVKGKGWLKEIRTADGKLRVSLQVDNGPAIDFLVGPGAVTFMGMASSKSPMGKLPVDATAVSEAVLGMP